MEIEAKANYLRVSPQKLRLLCQGLRGLTPAHALAKLALRSGTGRVDLEKLIKQGVANANHNYHLDPKSLRISRLAVNESYRLKRMDKSHGARFDRGLIQKRGSHLLLVLKGDEAKKVETAMVKKGKNGA